MVRLLSVLVPSLTIRESSKYQNLLYVPFTSPKQQDHEFSHQVAQSSLSINLLNKHLKEKTPCLCKDHAREEKSTDISDLLQVFHTVTLNHTFVPRGASSNRLVVVVTAVVTRSNHAAYCILYSAIK